jgi:hypothetical protein
MLALVALGVLPLSACAIQTVEAHRPAPVSWVDSSPANVRVEIVVEGTATVVYRDGNFRWIEGRRGERFAFRVTNHNRFPVGAILSADGQSLTADGPARESHPAYVIEPQGQITIGLWREDLGGGRELVFTDVARSLAARKGDTRNVGVLGVLVWRLEEKRPVPPVPITRDDRSKRPYGSEPEGIPGGAPSDATAVPPATHGGREVEREKSDRRDAPGIGVGAGDRVRDEAYLTDRYRRVGVLGTISVYYDDRYGLERAGVDLNQYYDPIPIDRRRSDPFPDYRGVRIP